MAACDLIRSLGSFWEPQDSRKKRPANGGELIEECPAIQGFLHYPKDGLRHMQSPVSRLTTAQERTDVPSDEGFIAARDATISGIPISQDAASSIATAHTRTARYSPAPSVCGIRQLTPISQELEMRISDASRNPNRVTVRIDTISLSSAPKHRHAIVAPLRKVTVAVMTKATSRNWS